jgi:yecA family protein
MLFEVTKRARSGQAAGASLLPDERAELQRELDRGRGMKSIHEAYGAFAALATAPHLVSPNDWLFTILGEPDFADMAHAQRVFDLLVRAYNSVLDEFARGARVAPAHDASDDAVAAWCRGYLVIAESDDEWTDDEVGDALLMPFAIVGGTFSLIGEHDDEGKIIEDDTRQRQLARESLPKMVKDLHVYWAARRDALAGVKTGAKQSFGRNEPCPCGSGKKYKRCCG